MKFNFTTMYRSKSEVDKHVSGLLHKVKNEHERNLRCFHIAQLYYKTQDYESTQRYVNMYLSVRDDSAAAYKLLGQAMEGLGLKEKAIAAYTKSLKLESDQSELVLKMCELLCDKDVEFDPIVARYWSERASLSFPHSSPVFMLKEKLLTFDSAVSSKDLEELLHAELKAKPMDLNVRIKLLKLYAESGRTEIALNHAFEVESKQTVLNSRSWYQCIHNICKAYHGNNNTKCGWEFYIQWISALDRLCSLIITENACQSSDMTENVDCIQSLDQAIQYGAQSGSKPEILKEFLKHISAQLAYHISLFLMKKAKKDNSLWKETKRLISPLLLFASNSSTRLDESWILSLKDNYRKHVQLWAYQAHCRAVQSGYLLMSLVKENNSEKMFFEKVNHFLSNDWRNQIYKKVFNIDTNSSLSHFISAMDYSKIPLKIPSSNSLKPSSYVCSFENSYFGSLHHLVWLGLRALKKLSILELKLPSFCTTSFKSLALSTKNLDNIGVESINQLDVDSFLYATVFCTASMLADQKINGYFSEDTPSILPADISSPLCTSDQSKWWSNLCNLVKGSLSPQMSSNENMSDLRFSLQRGLEVVRGEGLSPFLIVALARTFDTRSKTSKATEESEVCTARALHLWKIAYPILERLASNKTVLAPPKINYLFEYPLIEISSQEARSLFDEAKFFIGTYYMNAHKFEKAAEELKGIKTPQATFSLALVFQKWAEEQIEGLNGEEITSEIRCRHVVLATKARDYLLSTKDIIKNDPKHSLHSHVDAKIMDVEDMLARIEPENGVSEIDGNGSTDGSPSFSGGSPITETLNILTSSNQRKMLHHSSTPHRTTHFQEHRANRFNISEVIDLLSVQQSTSQLKMKQLFEQIKLVIDKLESISSEQRLQKNLIEGLNSRWNVFESEVKTTISDIKKDIKRPELCNMFDEDDYTDEMLQHYQSYPPYYAPPQRVVQNTASAPGAVSYVNPQYFSPRLDCSSFYNQQGALFSEGQQLPEFLRQPKVPQPLVHSLQPNIAPPLNLTNSGIPGTSRVLSNSVIPPNVMIPSSDGLQTVIPTVQPALSVTIPANNRFSNTSSNVPHNFQIPLPPQPKLNVEERVIEEETPPPTYDPFPDYKPLIPLPDEVEIHTGEEDEEIIFEKRAKLYRFVDKIWKERGVGNLKILKNKNTRRARILMRREQVHKICANHFITAEMELQPKADSKNAFVWSANDFADEKVQLEQFCVKFKTKEESEQFKEAFDKMLKELIELAEPSINNLVTPVSTAIETPFSSTTTSGFGSNAAFPQTINFSNMPSSLSNPFSTSNINSNVKTGFENLSSATNTQFFAATTASTFFPKTTASPLVTTSTSKISTSSNLPNMFSYSGMPIQSSPFNMSLFSTSPKISETTTPQSQPTKVGGFTFSLEQPKLKELEKPKVDKIEEPKEPGPLTKFTFPPTKSPSKDTFSNAFSILNTPKTNFLSSYTTTPSTNSTVLSENKPDTTYQLNIYQSKADSVAVTTTGSKTLLETPPKDNGDADNFVPTAIFEPSIPLPNLITVTTGEENEEVVFEERSQLYRFCKDSKQWKERGIGIMKILKHKENGSHRLLMRREQVLKVCCNHRITNDINLECASSSDRAVTWGAVDHSEEKPINEIFSLKFKTTEQAMKFMQAVEDIQAELYSSMTSNNDSVQNDSSAKPLTSNNLPTLAEILKPKPGSWECKDCYTRNNAGIDTCIACGFLKPGAVKTTAVLGAPTFSFGTVTFNHLTPSQPFNFGTSLTSSTSSSVLFKSPDSSIGKEKSSLVPGTNFFGDATKPSFTTTPTSSITSSKQGFVFPSPTSLSKTESTTFQFSLTATSPNKSQTDESGYDPEEEEDHLQFEPVIRLPEIVELVTGEENENVLYSHRAKLFRFDKSTKEWKERGVGDIKILEHKETGKIRFLMRREPIMKVCLNHAITDDISLRPMNSKSWIWYALDYSDGTHTEEQFALRFKSEDVAQEFYQEFNKVKIRIKELSSLATPENEKKLEKEIIKEPNNTDNSGSESDVEFVSVVQAPPELVEKALSLKLPANYYLYLEKSPCPGCCGCEPDDSDDLPPDNKNSDKKNEQTEVKNIEEKQPFHDNIFGKALASEMSVFSNSACSAPPSAATFTFAQQFTKLPLDEKTETQQTGLVSTKSSTVISPGSFFFNKGTSFASLPSQTSIFSTGVSTSDRNLPDFESAVKDMPSFESLSSESRVADKGTPAFMNKEFPSFDSLPKGPSFETKSNENFKWEGAGQALFSSKSSTKTDKIVKTDEYDEDETEENDKSDNKDNDPHFEPVIPLPPMIEVKTGEEDEEKLFSERGKLFRYDTDKKEWKERGLGDMKILKHKEKNVFRLLMRRDGVHKLVCNHLINKDISLKDKGEKALCWGANNFAEDKPVVEQLCIKFKTSAITQNFKDMVNNCIEMSKDVHSG